MSKLRSIDTCIWSDPWFESLETTEKLLFIYLITNEKTNMLGIYEATDKKIAFETDIEVEKVRGILNKFISDFKIKRVGNFLILINFLKHQRFNPNMKKSAIDIYNKLPDELKLSGKQLDRDKTNKAWETLTKGFSNHSETVSKIEVEVEDEIEKEYKDELDLETFYPVDKLKEFYLKDDILIKAMINNPANKIKDEAFLKKRIEEFNVICIETGENPRLWRDYTKHFRNWNKMEVAKKKSNDRLPTENLTF